MKLISTKEAIIDAVIVCGILGASLVASIPAPLPTTPGVTATVVTATPQPRRDDRGRVYVAPTRYIDCGDGPPPCATWDQRPTGGEGYRLMLDNIGRSVDADQVGPDETLSDGTVWHLIERTQR